MTLTGAPPELVRDAVESGTALPGHAGFAGELDGYLVRDVLGRVPLFFEREEPSEWSHRPQNLSDPETLPGGHIHTESGTEQYSSLPRLEPRDSNTAIEEIRNAIADAVEQVDTDGLAIAFSGGLDSAILAARLDAPLYTVGFPESHDVRAARSAARLLDCELSVVTLNHDRLTAALPAVTAATGRTNAMDVQIAAPLYILAAAVRGDGYERLALGQGADELFGGYTKVARAPTDPRVEADTIRGARRELVETLPAQLERDVLTLWEAGVEPVVPLLDDQVIHAALRAPEQLLVNDRGERKWGLRLAVRPWLPDRIVFREKKAVQYGSLVARELDRLARENGFKRRLDDHISAYIESVTNNPQ